MNKQNILYTIVGLFSGLIIGFFSANSFSRGVVGQGSAPTVAPMAQNSTTQPGGNIPEGHPNIDQPNVPQADIDTALDFAKKNPNDFEAQMKIAELYYTAQKFEDSATYLKNANKLKPENYEVIVNLGNVNFDAGKFADAQKWYSDALTKKKDDQDVRTDLGLTYVFQENPEFERAIKEFTTVLAANPRHIQALQNLTVAYTKKGDTAKAKETLARLESIDSSNIALPKLRDEINKIGQK